MKFFCRAVLFVAISISLTACQSTPKPVNDELLVEKSQLAADTYQLWSIKLEQVEELARYSPNTYASINTLWQRIETNYREFSDRPERMSATSLFGSDTYYDRFAQDIKDVERLYNDLIETQQQADVALRLSTEHLNYLDSISARDYYRSEYDRLARMYDRLFVIFDEQGRGRAELQQKEFLLRANTLEVKTIKRVHITPLENISRELRRKDARNLVPESFELVDLALIKAKGIIDVTPRDFDAIDASVAEINFQLSHSENMLKAVQALRALSRDHYERYILDTEEHLLAISRALSEADYRDRPLNVQFEEVLNVVEDQADELSTLRKENALLRSLLKEE
ncbi:hypothetical protein [Thaumasiovibrio sp. DFM-14]|uniref:hypothetical protein n=1 Tax=Thaumasiovibrio sp. DFM-14 TaxID=3384792 RepID=UPI0039A2D262